MGNSRLTGYPSIDKPWLKYYNNNAVEPFIPQVTAYNYLYMRNKHSLDDTALIYFKRKISYGKMFEYIDKAASAFASLGVKQEEVVALALPNTPENIYCMYGLNKIGAIADMIDLRSKGDILLHYLKESEATVRYPKTTLKSKNKVNGGSAKMLITV